MVGRRASESSDPLSLYYQGRRQGSHEVTGRFTHNTHFIRATAPPPASHHPSCNPYHSRLPAPFTCSAALATQPLRLHPPSSHLHPASRPSIAFFLREIFLG
ncbi:hypothetical protein E2C01_065015 [Portunus trituberculatus]|uniref:Uncharacterized protein n=1 Tax=Portunus trituberculatus TaxID=210409 RepID=A0A5B7HPZ0_PORTR|nr:hypothetical protein [Portunus trituberculatus]